MSALRRTLGRLLSSRSKRAIRSKINQAKARFVRSLMDYDAAKLVAALRSAGIAEGDTLFVHANFSHDSGFRGTPLDLVDALAVVVGERGNLMMVSIPFRGFARDYLLRNKPFDLKRTMSMMGLVTEMFRRRAGTLRSLHPTHPVLAFGKDAPWLVADHESCLAPCGNGSPFDKLRQLHGKILCFDVSFRAITFVHYVEEILSTRLPFPLYDEQVFSMMTVDAMGGRRIVQTRAFSTSVVRDVAKLERRMQQDGKIRTGRIGNSRFLLVAAEDVVSSFTEMVDSGNYPYELDR